MRFKLVKKASVKKASVCIAATLLLSTQPAWATLNILACEPEWQSLAQTLGGDQVTVDSATNAFQDPHHIEARPSLIAKARRADMVFCTGAELEVGWLPLLLSKSANPRIQTGQLGHFLATEQVSLIEKPSSTDRSQGDVHADGNPHVHWDPYRVKTIAAAFTQRLATLDPEHSEAYQQRLASFESRWQADIERWEADYQHLRGKQAIVYHKNWSYLLNWLGIKPVGDLEPKPGLPPTSRHLASLLETVQNTTIDYILVANYQDDKGAQWLSQRLDTPVSTLAFTVGGNPAATDLSRLYDDALMQLASRVQP